MQHLLHISYRFGWSSRCITLVELINRRLCSDLQLLIDLKQISLESPSIFWWSSQFYTFFQKYQRYVVFNWGPCYHRAWDRLPQLPLLLHGPGSNQHVDALWVTSDRVVLCFPAVARTVHAHSITPSFPNSRLITRCSRVFTASTPRERTVSCFIGYLVHTYSGSFSIISTSSYRKTRFRATRHPSIYFSCPPGDFVSLSCYRSITHAKIL